jgi:kynureninase
VTAAIPPGTAAPPAIPPAADWEAYRAEFPICRTAAYLNSCSLGALGRRVRAAIDRCLGLWDASGAAAWYGPWWAELDALREAFAALIGASAEEVALCPSITAALAAVAGSLDYRARPAVVVGEIDFPTVAYQWLARRRHGVEVRLVPSPDRLTIPLEHFAAAVDERTACVATSHVYFQSGAIQDIAALAAIAHARGAYLLVDAYQSAGQLPLDVRAAGVDFLVTGGLKWLLGGPGIAFLYVRAGLLPALEPENAGWFAHREQFAFDPLRLDYAPDARRMQGGTPAIVAVYAARAGVDYVAELGPGRLRARQRDLLAALATALRGAGLRPRLSGGPDAHAGILTVPVPDPAAAVAALARERIIVDQRPGVVRLSPYFYNTLADIERAAAALGRHAA